MKKRGPKVKQWKLQLLHENFDDILELLQQRYVLRQILFVYGFNVRYFYTRITKEERAKLQAVQKNRKDNGKIKWVATAELRTIVFPKLAMKYGRTLSCITGMKYFYENLITEKPLNSISNL